MASGLFALLDDVALLMDDVAAMGKIATKKTAGILADDLAVNAEKASGFISSRELPVLFKIAKGSLLSKAIILPVAFLLSAFLPFVIVPILLIGGVYLAFEGAEKIYHYIFDKSDAKAKAPVKKMTETELLAHEDKKVKDAIVVDFILSIEIIIIALGTVTDQPLKIQIVVVSIVAILATVGVYGLVALLVRMDDLGLRLIKSSNGKAGFSNSVGKGLVKTLPVLVRGLSILGTFAMILVAGGIFVHNLHFLDKLLQSLPSILAELIVGLSVGIIAVFVFKMVMKVIGKKH